LATISTMIFPFGCFAPNTVAQYLPSAGSFSKHPPSGKWAFDAAVAPIAIDSLLTLHLFQGHCCLEAFPLLGHLQHCTHGGKGLGVKEVKGRNPRARFQLELEAPAKNTKFSPFFPFFFFPSFLLPFPPLPFSSSPRLLTRRTSRVVEIPARTASKTPLRREKKLSRLESRLCAD
jgi:hypothetical protein